MKEPPAGVKFAAGGMRSYTLICRYNRHSMAERHSQNVPTSAAPLSIKTITNGDPTCITNASYVLREECLVRMAAYMRTCSGPEQLRDVIGDGSFGGLYRRDDEEMLRIWQTGVEEVRELLEHGWRRG